MDSGAALGYPILESPSGYEFGDIDVGSTVARSDPTWTEKNPSFMDPWVPGVDDSEQGREYSWVLQENPNTSSTLVQRDIPSENRAASTSKPESSASRRALLKRAMFRTCAMSFILLGQISSYPKMMIEGDRLPPFIHAPCHIEDQLAPECGERGSHQCLPRELAICTGLVQAFYGRTKANTDFVWNSIYEERARLHREVSLYSWASLPFIHHNAVPLFKSRRLVF